METSTPLDTFADLTGKLAVNQGGQADNKCLIMYNLATVLSLQGGIYFAADNDTVYDRWLKILQNQCGPQVAAPLDGINDLLEKILINQAGARVPADLDTNYTLVQKMVDNQIPLTSCYAMDKIVLISGGDMLTIAGDNLLLIS